MQKIISILLINMFFVFPIFAKDFKIGDKTISIPNPEGFTIVTKEMTGVTYLQSKMIVPENILISAYIENASKDLAEKGGVPSLEKTFAIQIKRDLFNKNVGKDVFDAMSELIKKQNEEFVQNIKKDVERITNRSSNELAKDLNIDFALKVKNVVPLKPHIDRDNILSFSTYIKFENSINNGEEKTSEKATAIVSASITNVDGKILYIGAYGGKDDLEWTRQASQKWVEKIISLNNPPPEKTLKSNSGNLLKKYKTLIKIAIFMLFSSIVGLFYKKGKPNKSISKEKKKEISEK